MSIQMPVNPDTYFVDHANGNRAPRNGREFDVRLTDILDGWIDYARRDLPQSPRNKLDVASLAIDFGASRPLASWGMPVNRFGDIAHEIQLMKMNGDIVMKPQLATNHENKIKDYPQTVRVSPNTMDLIDEYQSVLSANRSVVCRHLMAVSFRWYNQDVFEGRKLNAYVQEIDPYVDQFKGTLEQAAKYGRDDLDMQI